MPDLPELPFVMVVWNDANVGGDDAVSLDTVHIYHEATVVHTIGWVLKENEKGISIVTEYYDDTFRGRTFIPRPMIKDVIPFTISKKRDRRARHPRPDPDARVSPEPSS